MQKISILMIAFVISFIASADNRSISLTVATVHPVTMPWTTLIRDYFIPECERRIKLSKQEHSINWSSHYGNLYKWKDSLNGVQVGLSDIGWVGSVWESSRLPLQNITYDLPFITDNLVALVDVVNQLHEDIPELAEGWREHNVEFLAATGTDTYHLVTNFPVETIDDLKGKRILAPGAASIWLKGTGAIAVNGALTTYYMQLKTGAAEGAVTILTGAYPFKLHEVAPYVTLVGVGAQSVGALTVNRDRWNMLPDEVKKIIKEVALDYSRLSSQAGMRRYLIAMQKLKAEGAIFSTLSGQEKQRWIDGLPPLSQQWVERYQAMGLPAKRVLFELMDGLRSKGVTPTFDWDKVVSNQVGLN
jgi:TRAP-type C4-dicarboxylate transport system substrate-binding protein